MGDLDSCCKLSASLKYTCFPKTEKTVLCNCLEILLRFPLICMNALRDLFTNNAQIKSPKNKNFLLEFTWGNRSSSNYKMATFVFLSSKRKILTD